MDGRHQLVNADSGEVIVPRLELATTFWQRFRGLQFRHALAADQGLMILPCRSIHTHWMRFAIDAAMLDADGIVLAILPAVTPWRIVRQVPRTRSILETNAGVLSKRVQVGNRTRIIGPSEMEM